MDLISKGRFYLESRSQVMVEVLKNLLPQSYEPKIVLELVFPTNSTNKIWGIF